MQTSQKVRFVAACRCCCRNTIQWEKSRRVVTNSFLISTPNSAMLPGDDVQLRKSHSLSNNFLPLLQKVVLFKKIIFLDKNRLRIKRPCNYYSLRLGHDSESTPVLTLPSNTIPSNTTKRENHGSESDMSAGGVSAINRTPGALSWTSTIARKTIWTHMCPDTSRLSNTFELGKFLD